MTVAPIKIREHLIGPGHPAYIIAEMSGNHGHSFEQAVKLVEEAKSCGADAVKLQTYTADTLTIDCRNKFFQIKGTIWEGKNLYDLYREAFTPWDWQPKLKEIANTLGLDCFSTPFDSTAVDFLEAMDVPAHKIASFELVDVALIRKVALTGKPVIMSTGMASLEEIHEAVDAFREAGGTQLALLKCTSAYPSPPDEMNLKTIADLAKTFRVPIGLSDHTLGFTVPAAAVALGACIVEKHFTLSRSLPGPDSAFSLEPSEFKEMVKAIREVEAALGKVNYKMSSHEQSSRNFRRSLFAVRDIESGEPFTTDNVRSIRPGYGLAPKYLDKLLGARASAPITAGTPLSWELVKQ
jgi:pseudaminic acid synthase